MTTVLQALTPAFAAASLLATGCARLKDKIPESPSAIEQNLKLHQELSIHSDDDTFKRNPEFWIGRVGVVRKKDGKCDGAVAANWETAPLRYTPPEGEAPEPDTHTGYPLGEKSTEPELRGSEIITKQIAAAVQAMSYLTARFDGKMVFEIVLTDLAVQRLAPSTKFDAAVTQWKQSNPELMSSPDVCWIFVVEGYTHKTLVKKKFTEFKGKAKGGFAGIRVDGAYYEGEQAYSLDHIFGLSPGILRRPAGGQERLRASQDDLEALRKIELLPPPK